MYKKALLSIVLISAFCACLVTLSRAAGKYQDHYAEYPPEAYMIGLGEVVGSGNETRDSIAAQALARRDLVWQVRVMVREGALEHICSPASLAGKIPECRDLVLTVVSSTMEEASNVSRVVSSALRGGMYRAVVVMPRAESSERLALAEEAAARQGLEALGKYKKGDRAALEKARLEYLRALALGVERELIQGVKKDSGALFRQLELEVDKLDKSGGSGN